MSKLATDKNGHYLTTPEAQALCEVRHAVEILAGVVGSVITILRQNPLVNELAGTGLQKARDRLAKAHHVLKGPDDAKDA